MKFQETSEIFSKLTGKNLGRYQEAPPLVIDLSNRSEVDSIYSLVLKMEQSFQKNSGPIELYEGDFKRLKEAYSSGREEDIRVALEELVTTIHFDQNMGISALLSQ